jgi:hypothetical protein
MWELFQQLYVQMSLDLMTKLSRGLVGIMREKTHPEECIRQARDQLHGPGQASPLRKYSRTPPNHIASPRQSYVRQSRHFLITQLD